MARLKTDEMLKTKYIHFPSVDKQAPSRVNEEIIVDIRKNTNYFTTRKALNWTSLQLAPSILVKVTQHDSQQEQEAAAFVYFNGVP